LKLLAHGTRGYLILTLLLAMTMCGAQNTPASQTLPVPGGVIDLTLPQEQLAVSQTDLLDWINTAANTVSGYYGHFPVKHLTLRVRSDSGDSVHRGITYPWNGGLILIAVGRNATVADLKNDWMLTHEMIHLAFPSMADSHHWIEEGISTYVEPVSRARVGNISVARMWKEFVHDMPQGQPESGDHGLDRTPTWGRTYWGGAMFCLVADVRIRERTHNRKGLQDALRGILNGGGIITEDWEIEQALRLGDEATGTTVLMDLYREMRDKPAPVDLDQLWRKLGLQIQHDQVVFIDSAPEAAIRKAITDKEADNKPH
jgi:hypothetical protein